MRSRTATFPVLPTKSDAEVKGPAKADSKSRKASAPTTLPTGPIVPPPLHRGNSIDGTPEAAKIVPLYHKVLAYEEQIDDFLTHYVRVIKAHRQAVVHQELLSLAQQRLFLAHGGAPSDVDLDPIVQLAKADPWAGHMARVTEIQTLQTQGVANFRRALADLVPGVVRSGSLDSCSGSALPSPSTRARLITSHPRQVHEAAKSPLEPGRYARRASCAV